MAETVPNLLFLIAIFQVCLQYLVVQTADDYSEDLSRTEQTIGVNDFTGTTTDIPTPTESIDGGWIPTTEVYLTEQPPVTAKDVTKAVEEILKSIASKKAPKMDAQAALFNHLTNSWSQNSKPDWVEKLKKAILAQSPITPTVSKPVQATDWLRYQVRLEVFLRNYLLKETEKCSHPASFDYPGSVPKNSDLKKAFNFTITLLGTDRIYETLIEENCTEAKRVQELNTNGKISCPRFCSSMYYAAAGSILVLKANLQNVKEFVVRIGHFVDDNSGLDTWQQYPNMRSFKRFKVLGNAEQKVQMPIVFGGMVYIGEINSTITLKNVTFEISGVVETPSFKFPEMTLIDWREDSQKKLAPWGDLISDQFIISYPKKVLDKIADPEELLIHWERILDGINEVAGTPYKTSREHIAFTRDLPNNDSKMHAGWPLMALEKTGENLTEFTQLWKDSPTMDAFFHTLGHNHERHLRLLKFKDSESIVNEVFVDYIKNIVHGVTPLQRVRKQYRPENILKTVGSYLDNGAKFENFFSSGVAQLFYFDFVRNFGWDTLYKLAKVSRDSNVFGEENRRNAFAVALSEIQKENMAGYLKSWGIAVSKEVEDKIGKLPKSGILAKQLVDMAKEQIEAESIERAKGKGRGIQKGRDQTATTTESPDRDGEDLDNDDGPEVSTTEVSPTEGPSPTPETLLDEETQQGRGFDIISPEEMGRRKELWKLKSKGNDLDQLLDSVTTIQGAHKVGQLLVYGAAIPVLAGENGKHKKSGSVPVVAASHNGKGRIVFLTHEDFLLKSPTPGYFDKFQVNCIMWAAQYDEKKAADFKPVVTKHPKYPTKLAQYLTESGYPTQEIAEADIDLSKVNLLIIPFGLDLSREFGNTLKPFVEKGGGLIIAANSGARNESYIRTMVANELAKISGVRYIHKDAYPTTPEKSFNSSKSLLAYTSVVDSVRALAEVIGKVELSEKSATLDDASMDNILITLQLAQQNLDKSDLSWVESIKKKFLSLKPINPTDENKVNMTDALKFRVRIETTVMDNFFDANDNYSHPASAYFPGAIPADSNFKIKHESTIILDKNTLLETLLHENCTDSPSYQTLTNSTKTSCSEWCPTEFYAPPGVKVTIKFPSQDVQGFSIYNGRFENVPDKLVWVKYPTIRYIKDFPTKHFAEFNSPFGGPIFVGKIITSLGADVVPYEISGVIETPHFFFGKTRLTDWKRIRELPGPWGIFTSPQLQLKLPRRAFHDIENPEELMITWERMLDAFNEFHSISYRSHKERINFDPMLTIAGALMVSGLIQAQMYTSRTAASVKELWGVGYSQKAFLHEFGHNHDLMWWRLNGGYQITNEINIGYVRSTVHRNINDAYRGVGPDTVSLLENYLKGQPNYDKFQDAASRWFYHDLHRNFGWNVYFKLAVLSSGVKFPDDDAFRRDWLLVTLSEILKRNMAKYLESWGMKFSKDAIQKVSKLPDSHYRAQNVLDYAQQQVFAVNAYINATKASVKYLKQVEAAITDELDNFTAEVKNAHKKASEQIKQAIKVGTSTAKNAAKNATSDIKNFIKSATTETKASIKSPLVLAKDHAKTAVNTANDITKRYTNDINAAVKKATADIKAASKTEKEKKKSASKNPKEEADRIEKDATDEAQAVKKQVAGEVTSLLEKVKNDSEATIKKSLEEIMELVKTATKEVGIAAKKFEELVATTAKQATEMAVGTSKKAIDVGINLSKVTAQSAVSAVEKFMRYSNDNFKNASDSAISAINTTMEIAQAAGNVVKNMSRPMLEIGEASSIAISKDKVALTTIDKKIKIAKKETAEKYAEFVTLVLDNADTTWTKPKEDVDILIKKMSNETETMMSNGIKDVKACEDKVNNELSTVLEKSVETIKSYGKRVIEALEKAKPVTAS